MALNFESEPILLRKASCFQNLAPSTVVWRQFDIQIPRNKQKHFLADRFNPIIKNHTIMSEFDATPQAMHLKSSIYILNLSFLILICGSKIGLNFTTPLAFIIQSSFYNAIRLFCRLDIEL
jgi:hypothetical protein